MSEEANPAAAASFILTEASPILRWMKPRLKNSMGELAGVALRARTLAKLRARDEGAFGPFMGVSSGAGLHLEGKHPEFVCSKDPAFDIRQGRIRRALFLLLRGRGRNPGARGFEKQLELRRRRSAELLRRDVAGAVPGGVDGVHVGGGVDQKLDGAKRSGGAAGGGTVEGGGAVGAAGAVDVGGFSAKDVAEDGGAAVKGGDFERRTENHGAEELRGRSDFSTAALKAARSSTAASSRRKETASAGGGGHGFVGPRHMVEVRGEEERE